MVTPNERALALAQRVRALPEVQMRAQWVRRELSELSADAALEVVRTAHDCTEGRCAPFPELWLALALALGQPEGAALRRRLLDEARSAQLLALSALLDARPASERDPRASAVPDFGRERPLTLGERKSLARTHDRLLLSRVVRDPHPDVMRILLGNSSLTELDVLRAASARPVSSEVLREIFTSARWIKRPAVQSALVLNPYCPRDVALFLVPQLSRSDARRALDVSGLDRMVRLACLRVVRGGVRH